MSDIADKLGPARGQITEEQVRAKLLKLASAFVDRAESATEPSDAQIYGETAAVVFDAARARPKMEDVPPNGG